MKSAPAVEIKKLNRSFGPKQVLQDISLEIATGEIIGIVGSNGSGKTTLLRILATLLLPSSGEVLIDGQRITHSTSEIRKLIGWVSTSDGGFIPRFTGHENLHFFGALYGLTSKQVERVIGEYSSLTPFQAALQTPFYLCSAGMKQILRIARALLARPSIILFDEPLRSLDDKTSDFISSFLIQFLGPSTREEPTIIATNMNASTNKITSTAKTLIFTTPNGEDVNRWRGARKVELRDGVIYV